MAALVTHGTRFWDVLETCEGAAGRWGRIHTL